MNSKVKVSYVILLSRTTIILYKVYESLIYTNIEKIKKSITSL